MKRILDGEKPSTVFKALIGEKPSLTNGDLAVAFRKLFPSVGVEGMSIIWKWRGPESKVGLSDAALDEKLLECMRQVGYLK
jgi:hypothetical protein